MYMMLTVHDLTDKTIEAKLVNLLEIGKKCTINVYQNKYKCGYR